MSGKFISTKFQIMSKQLVRKTFALSLSRLAINNGQLIDNKPKPKKKEFRLFHLIHIYVY